MSERGSLCVVGCSTSGTPHDCCLYINLKVCACGTKKKSIKCVVTYSLEYTVLRPPQLLFPVEFFCFCLFVSFLNDDCVFKREVGRINPVFLPAERLTDSHRQDLFVILRDFSGSTQVLIPQEEVRLTRVTAADPERAVLVQSWTIPLKPRISCVWSLTVVWRRHCAASLWSRSSRWLEESDHDRRARTTRFDQLSLHVYCSMLSVSKPLILPVAFVKVGESVHRLSVAAIFLSFYIFLRS